jgi:hypothetical protein
LPSPPADDIVLPYTHPKKHAADDEGDERAGEPSRLPAKRFADHGAYHGDDHQPDDGGRTEQQHKADRLRRGLDVKVHRLADLASLERCIGAHGGLLDLRRAAPLGLFGLTLRPGVH